LSSRQFACATKVHVVVKKKEQAMKKLVGIGALLWTVSCATTPNVSYTTNSQAIVDELTTHAPDFVDKMPVPDGARVAVFNLDGEMPEAANPTESVYDHLMIALAKRKVNVVERDSEGLQASVLESWSDSLPFRVSSPCQGECDSTTTTPAPPPPPPAPARNGPAIVIQTCGTSPCDAKDGATGTCPTCKGPLIATSADDMLKIVNLLGKLDAPPPAAGPTTTTKAGVNPGDVDGVPVAERGYADVFGRVQLPTWFKKDGGKIVAEQASATHVLGFRVLTLGTAIEDGETDDRIVRHTRVDLVLRLIRTSDGVVVWSDRVSTEKRENFPRAIAGKLKAAPFEFSKSQYAPESKDRGGGLLGGGIGNLFGG
jgi:TolB-like protein